MKQIISVVFLTTLHCGAFGQRTETVVKTIELVREQSIYLADGAEALFKNNSRQTVTVSLPVNTISWYYAFTTTTGESNAVLNLGLQLAKSQTVILGKLTDIETTINVPKGSGAIDVYLLDRQNSESFTSGTLLTSKSFQYRINGTRTGRTRGVVEVNDGLKGVWYLGLRNTSASSGVHVRIEVFALVEENIYIDEWIQKSLDDIQLSLMNDFATNLSGREEVCACVSRKVSGSYVPSQWKTFSNSRKWEILRYLREGCYTETDNEILMLGEKRFLEEQIQRKKDKSSAMDEANEKIRLSRAAAQIGDYRDAKTKMLEGISFIESNPLIKATYQGKYLSHYHSDCAWFCILLNEVDEGGEHLKKSLAADRDNMFAWGNMGIYHLVSGNYRQAEEAFTRYKRKQRFPDGRKWFEVVANDLELLEEKGISNEGFAKVRELLKIK